jgi:hypothetical protein
MIRGVLSKIDKAKKSNVLCNAEQMHFVGYIEKKIMFKAQYCSAEQITKHSEVN